jgi:Asp-tRNA(Asn)/Glu-tRNA(Gln) amidotransferase C subunit
MAEMISKEIFLSMAEASGLDVKDPHMEELFGFVTKVLPSLRVIDRLDLTDVEPLSTFIPQKE